MRFLFRSLLCLALIHLCSSAVSGEDIPLRDWPLPDSLQKEGGGPAGTGFVAIQPCRVVDTRPSQGFPAAWGAPILAANATRDFDINSAPHCPGIPTTGVHAYSLNFTITEPVGAGDLRAWPQGSPPATPTSILNWPAAGVTIANATMLSASFATGGITVQVAGSNAHLIIDINGYTTQNYNVGEQFLALGNVAGPVVLASNASASSGSSGVGGFVSSAGAVYGVLGQASFMAAAQSAGVAGRNTALGAVARYGVLGTTTSTGNNAAGVKGIGGTGETSGTGVTGSIGVIGTAQTDAGVAGLSEYRGVIGIKFSAAGAFQAEGVVGGDVGGTNYGLYSLGPTGASGMKSFIEPHPTDASQVVRYVSLEGPEAGTYFRGRARFERGLARITVPDHFRMVTDAEGLSVQITPIGEMTSVAVVKADLTEIVVKGSRNVEFYYAVNGVRRTFKDFQPVGPGGEYMPSSPSQPMPDYLSAGQKDLLISNGTYNADGTVNMETAKRLGWDKKWEKRQTASK